MRLSGVIAAGSPWRRKNPCAFSERSAWWSHSCLSALRWREPPRPWAPRRCLKLGTGAPNTGAWPQAFTLAPGGQAVFGISVGAPGPVQVGINWSGPPLAVALRDPSGRIQKQATGQRPPSVRLDHAAHAAGVWSLVISNPAPVQAPVAPAGQPSVPATAQGQVGANFPHANPVSPPTAAATGPQAAQPSQVAPAGPALSPCERAGNCPPQGSIAITAPQAGTVWSTGSYHVIQWAFSGTRSTTADVTLWQNNQQVATVWTGSATGKAAYIVPFGAPAGTYELRVTLQADRRVEARQPVAIVPTAVTVTAPAAALVTGAPHTITWSYTGSITTMKLSVVDPYGTVVQSFPNVPAGSNGKGSWPWTAPVLTGMKTSAEYRFQVSGTFHKDVTNNNAMTEVVLGTSNPFTVRLPKIEVGAPPYRRRRDGMLSGETVPVVLDERAQRQAGGNPAVQGKQGAPDHRGEPSVRREQHDHVDRAERV